MGLSSSSSKTDTTQNQNTNQTETGTTTPVTPDWLTQAAQGYVGQIGSFAQQDPNSFVAGASPLQNSAWNNAGSLGDWKGQAATAAGMAQGAGNAAPNLAGAMGRYAGGMGLTPNAQMSGGGGAQMAASQLGSDPMNGGATHSTPLAPPVGGPFSGASSQQPTGLVSGQGYSMAPAQPGYAQPRSGYPIGGGPPAQQGPAYSYNPSTVGAAQIAQTPGATASSAAPASLLDNLSSYQNPYTQQVTNASLADFDHNAAQQQAQLQAQGAAAGAFGGSRFGIAQSNLMDDQARSRATLDSGLQDQGFQQATALSGQDAAARQQASQFNAQNQTQNSQFNAGQNQAQALAQAGFGQQAGLANQASYDQAGQYNAGANNQMSQFNATQQDNSLNRQLQAAGMLGGLANDYGTGTRADLGTMATMGDQQRQIEQAYSMAGPAQLQLEGQLSGMTPYDILVGRQVNGNTTGQMSGTGTSNTTQSPSLFSQLLQGGQMAAAFM